MYLKKWLGWQMILLRCELSRSSPLMFLSPFFFSSYVSKCTVLDCWNRIQFSFDSGIVFSLFLSRFRHLPDLEYFFMQERLWKITAAGQICHQIAFSSRLRFQEQNRSWEKKRVAHNLAKAVMDFWHSIEVYRVICTILAYSVFFPTVCVFFRKNVH